jgi:hypothetical protein
MVLARGTITVIDCIVRGRIILTYTPGLKLATLASLPELVHAKAREVSTKLTELETEGDL